MPRVKYQQNLRFAADFCKKQRFTYHEWHRVNTNLQPRYLIVNPPETYFSENYTGKTIVFHAIFLPDPKDHKRGSFFSFETFNVVEFTMRYVEGRWVYSKVIGSDIPMTILEIQKMYKVKFNTPKNKTKQR